MRFAWPILVTLMIVGTCVHALVIPEQFKSTNAATILGLDKEENITKDDVKKAAKNLWKKWHPDQFPKGKFSDADRTAATLLAQMIGNARDTLLKFLKEGGVHKPEGKQSESPTTHADPDDTQFAWSPNPARPNNFDWRDTFTDSSEPSNSSEMSVNSADRRLGGTLFGFLENYPDLTKAVMHFKVSNVRLENDGVKEVGEALIIVEPKNFPFIEIRYMAKAIDKSTQPMVIKKRMAKYIRRRHAGNGIDLDGIGFGWGNYLMRAFHTGHATQPFKVVPTPEDGVYHIQTEKDFALLEMFPTGFSTPYVLELINTDISALLSGSGNLTWKDVELEKEQVILLPWLKDCSKRLEQPF